MVRWLRLHTPNARGLGSIPGGGTRSHRSQLKILHATLRPGTAKYIKRIDIKKKKKKNKEQAMLKEVGLNGIGNLKV